VLSLWIVALPLGYFTALVLGLEPWIVYTAILAEEPIKATFGLIRLRSRKWLHDVTK
jgi:Na+-driven multidrug efflux pump